MRVTPSILVICGLIVGVYCKALLEGDKEVIKVQTYIEERKPDINPRYRLHYHVAPPVGWMNDPNGFVFYKNEFHLFFQYYPFKTVWGPMHWGHVSSPDLVHWKELPPALVPEEEMCFSGSAVVDGDKMVLLYTGRVITDSEPFFNESQYLAHSDDGINFNKYEGNPVLSAPSDGSADFRDPKAWKYGDYWYVVIGSKTADGRGRVLLYRSLDMTDWQFLTVLAESNGNLGYMWECPDFFELDGKFILLMSPQGVKQQGDRFINLYQTGYIIGNFNYDTHQFVPEVDFQELDFGHDFYATQTTEKDGKRYLVAWFGMWDDPHPEEADGWVNAMTIVRELKLSNDNRIISKPVSAIESIRNQVLTTNKFGRAQNLNYGSTVELIVTFDLEEKLEILIEGQDGGNNGNGRVWLRWDPETRKVVLDRDGNVRQVEWIPIKSLTWRIFLDTSSVELFCGEGEVVFSSRVYPLGGWRVTNFSYQTLDIKAYQLNTSV